MPSPGEPRADGPGTKTSTRGILVAAGLLGGLGVALGAFGAHGLEGRVPPSRIDTFETGVRYHLVHAVALLALLGAVGRGIAAGTARVVASLWIVGTVVFAGSLYALVLLDLPILGAVTPLGGILYIVGWGWLTTAALRGPRELPPPSDGLSP